MTVALDPALFFRKVRSAPFDGSLTQSQVDGLNAMLASAPPLMDTSALAYCLATAHHETGGAMIPRVEAMNYTTAAQIKKTWPKRFASLSEAEPYVRNPVALAIKVYGGRMGNRPAPSTDGWDLRGMGLVQATGGDNADRGTRRLRELGYLTAAQDLRKTPSLMLEHDIAAAMLFVGLTEGWYTGKKLADYFGPGRNLPTQARAMVNPDGNGPAVAKLHAAYLAALQAGGHKPGAVAQSVPTGPVATSPLPAPAPAAPVPPGASSAAPPLPPVGDTGKPNLTSRIFLAIADAFMGRRK